MFFIKIEAKYGNELKYAIGWLSANVQVTYHSVSSTESTILQPFSFNSVHAFVVISLAAH